MVPRVECRNVGKEFRHSPQAMSLREWFIRAVGARRVPRNVPAFRLSGFDLRAGRGDRVSLIGGNGSGKSTILRLIAGIYTPSEGEIVTRGRIAAVIELGTGLHPELTGAENIHLYGAILGMSRQETRARFAEIVEFAEIGDYIHVPIKYYSSGMLARLAFSIAMASDPDILLLDEVLAVGDQAFRARCHDRIAEHLDRGAAVIIASHDLDLVRSQASEAIWLDAGRVRMRGEANEVVDAYLASMSHAERAPESDHHASALDRQLVYPEA